MASIRLDPPAQFDFSKPDEWPKWKRRFQQYRSAAGLSTESQTRQIDTLLYCMGEEAERVLTSTNITADDRKQYDAVVTKFDEYFKVRRNTIFERAKFNRRSQREGESVEQYITDLYELVEFCELGDLKEEMLRNRLVVGIRDLALSEKMQTTANLTLEKANMMIRQREAIKEHTREVQEECEAATLNRLRKGSAIGGGNSQCSYRPRSRQPTSNGPHCTRCGRTRHAVGDRCPAIGATCHKCNRKGHFSAQCFSKTVAMVSTGTKPIREDPQDDQLTFLGSVTSSEENSWSVELHLKQKTLTFKLDTEAEVTAISEEAYRLIGKPRLQRCTKTLCGPAQQALKVKGHFLGWLRHGLKSTRRRIYVVCGLKKNLLGLPAIVRKIYSAEVDQPKIVSFLKSFRALALLERSTILCSGMMPSLIRSVFPATWQYPSDRK